MTDHVWNHLHCVEAEISDLQHQVRAAEAARNFGRARILADQVRTAETTRDGVLSRLGNALCAAA